MRRDEISDRARAELAAIDAALDGTPVAQEHAELAVVAQLVRDSRPRPRPEFTAALDARAAEGFARTRVSGDRGHASFAGWLGARSGIRVLAATASVVVVLVATIAVVASHGGSGARSGSAAPRVNHAGPAQSTPAKAGVERPSSATSPSATAPSAPERKVVRSATLDVGVPEAAIQSTSQKVFALVSAAGGYVNSSSVSSSAGSGAGDAGSEGGATFEVRLPSGAVASTIASLSQLGHVRSETDNTNDVSERYGSLTGSLQDARAQRSGLLKQIAATAEGARREGLEAQLHAVERTIASLQQSLSSLRTRIDMTPLALSLTPERGSGGGAAPAPFTPGGAASAAAEVLSAALAVLLIAAAAALPAALVALCVWGAFAAARRRRREQALSGR
jgi:hypothetical protein